MRRFVCLSAGVLLVAACSTGSGGGAGDRAAEGSPGPQTYTVTLDGESPTYAAIFTSFFPSALRVHPGDTIRFEVAHFNGEPHAVALGRLVDAAAAKLDELGPGSTIAQQENSPEMLNLPNVFPHVFGPGTSAYANQSAAAPCLLEDGVPPLSLTGGAPGCAEQRLTPFTGRESFYNGGALQEDEGAFTVRLADDIAPGTYAFMCLNHRAPMRGHFEVVAPDVKVPSPAEVTRRGHDEFAAVEEALAPTAEEMHHGTADHAYIGGSDPAIDPIGYTQVTEFGPEDLTVPAGGTVTWTVSGFHSLSFNASDSDVGSLFPGPDGSFRLNIKGKPVGFPIPAEAFVLPPADDGHPMTVDAGSWDGTGFHSTGIIQSLPPITLTIRQTFTRPGTYAFRCLVHPDMKGTVRVT